LTSKTPLVTLIIIMLATGLSQRPRKRHLQQKLFPSPATRKGARRKPTRARGSSHGCSHEARPEIKARYPLHITLRVVPEVGSLRRRDLYRAVRDASVVAAVRERIRIIHISIQDTHIHLLVEASDNLALTRGMQGFQISVARNVNSALRTDAVRRRRGAVFAGRYHLVVIRSPTQARNVLAYVLGNWKKHRAGRGDLPATWLADPFSSGIQFPDWHERRDEPCLPRLPRDYEPLIVRRPRSWLLACGWKRVGPIRASDIPCQRTR
jgi:putative transposase